MGVEDFELLPMSILTERELEIFRRLLEAKSNKAIAEELGLTLKGVEKRLTNIYHKIGVHSRSEAMRFWAMRHGRVFPPLNHHKSDVT